MPVVPVVWAVCCALGRVPYRSVATKINCFLLSFLRNGSSMSAATYSSGPKGLERSKHSLVFVSSPVFCTRIIVCDCWGGVVRHLLSTEVVRNRILHAMFFRLFRQQRVACETDRFGKTYGRTNYCKALSSVDTHRRVLLVSWGTAEFDFPMGLMVSW